MPPKVSSSSSRFCLQTGEKRLPPHLTGARAIDDCRYGIDTGGEASCISTDNLLHTAPKQRATQQLDLEGCGHGEGCYPRVRVPGHTNDISWRSRVYPASETVGCGLIGLWVTTGNRHQADEGRDALNKQKISHFYFPCNS